MDCKCARGLIYPFPTYHLPSLSRHSAWSAGRRVVRLVLVAPAPASRSQETQPSSPRALRSCQLLLQQKCGGGILQAEMPPGRSLHSPPPAPASCPSFPVAGPLSPPFEIQSLVSTASKTFPAPSQISPEMCPAPMPGQKPPAYSPQLEGLRPHQSCLLNALCIP